MRFTWITDDARDWLTPVPYNPSVPNRAFPVIYTDDVARLVRFYTALGFEKTYQFPPEGEAGYVSLSRGESGLGITTTDSPRELAGIEVGAGPRFEMFVYVDELDGCVDRLRRDGVRVLRDPREMPWGERLAYVSDPDGNPVALAQTAG